MSLWKFVKGPYRGLTALTVDKEKLRDGVARPKDRNLITLYVNEEIVSFRGVTEGENIVTVHVYSKRDELPTKATIKLIKIKLLMILF